MKDWKQIVAVAATTTFLLVGCGGSSSDSSDGGGITPPTGSTFTDENATAFLEKIDASVPGCTYIESTATATQYSTALSAAVEKVQYSTAFDKVVQATETETQEIECKDADGNVEGKVVLTGITNADETQLDVTADFQECNMGNQTEQDTVVDGVLIIGVTQDLLTDELTGITASTGADGLNIVDTDELRDVTLNLTGFDAAPNEATQADPATVVLEHFGLTDNDNADESFQLDDCSGTMYQDSATMKTVINLSHCDYSTDKDGEFVISSTDIVLDENSGLVNGVVTVTASDDTNMVYTLEDSLGVVAVTVNGEDFGMLDCTDVNAP